MPWNSTPSNKLYSRINADAVYCHIDISREPFYEKFELIIIGNKSTFEGRQYY